jgi:hypothetical protein
MKYLVLAIVGLGLAACEGSYSTDGKRYVGTCSIYLSADQCAWAAAAGKAAGDRDAANAWLAIHYCETQPDVCEH